MEDSSTSFTGLDFPIPFSLILPGDTSLVASRGLDKDELGRELAVVLRTGGIAFGLGIVREIDPFATSVVPDGFLSSPGGERVAVVAVPDTLAARRTGRAGGAVVAIIYVQDVTGGREITRRTPT